MKIRNKKLGFLYSVFGFFRDSKFGIRNSKHGFALVELLIAVVLFGIITSFVLIAYAKVSEQLFMTTLAYETALSFRQAQSFGVSAKQFGTGAGSFDYAYGVHFAAAADTRFVLFADTDKDVMYETGGDTDTGCVAGSECVSVYRIERGNRIEKFCGVRSLDGEEECTLLTAVPVWFLDVLFLRPNPDAIIRTDQVDSSYKAARIYLVSPSGVRRSVEVWNTGQISIK